MQFENTALFCFLISVQFSRVNNQRYAYSCGKENPNFYQEMERNASCILICSSYQPATLSLCTLKVQGIETH